MVPRTNTLSVRPQGLSCFREPFCFISYLKLGNHLHLPKQNSRQVPTTQLNCVVRAKSSSNKMYPKRGSPTLRSARSSEQSLEGCGDTQLQRPHRLVARMSRRGRDSPGSTPGGGIREGRNSGGAEFGGGEIDGPLGYARHCARRGRGDSFSLLRV